MDAKGFILSLAIYAFLYVLACNIALSNYLKQFPKDPRRPRPGMFQALERSWLSILMVWNWKFLPRESSPTLRFQVACCRWMLVASPFYAIYLAVVLL